MENFALLITIATSIILTAVVVSTMKLAPYFGLHTIFNGMTVGFSMFFLRRIIEFDALYSIVPPAIALYVVFFDRYFLILIADAFILYGLWQYCKGIRRFMIKHLRSEGL